MSESERIIYVAANAGHGDTFVNAIQANYVYAGVTVVFGLIVIALVYELINDLIELIYTWLTRKKKTRD